MQERNSNSKETLVVSGLASTLLLVLSWRAFKYFFFAETFLSLRPYYENGKNSWRVAFSNLGGVFFRPGLFLAELWSNLVLPADPTVYHIRNYIFCALNLVLLYLVLLKFTRSRPARIIAFGLFAGSKMHFTNVGYMNIFEASVLLMTILLTVLFWFRYIEARRVMDYYLSLIFCILCVYTKDNGFLVIGILAAMVLAFGLERSGLKSQAYYWALRLAPLAIIGASYFVLRYTLAGPIDPHNPTYYPRISALNTILQVGGFLATVGNLSLVLPSVMGGPGFTGLLTGDSRLIEFILCTGLWLFIVYTMWLRRSSWRLLIVPVVWIGLYMLPILLIRNHQIYYYQEPLVGVVLLVGVCLDQARRWSLVTWTILVALITVNGFVSDQRSYYVWQDCANRAEVVKPIVASLKSNPPKSIVFTTVRERINSWFFILGGPMIGQLLGSPDTQVDIVDSTSPINGEAFVFDLDRMSTTNDGQRQMRSGAMTLPSLNALAPSGTKAGEAFNIQPDGQAAISVNCQNATPETVIMFDNRPLITTFGSPIWLTAFVPQELFAVPGKHEVYIKNGLGESNKLEFLVRP